MATAALPKALSNAVREGRWYGGAPGQGTRCPICRRRVIKVADALREHAWLEQSTVGGSGQDGCLPGRWATVGLASIVWLLALLHDCGADGEGIGGEGVGRGLGWLQFAPLGAVCSSRLSQRVARY